MTTSEQPNEDRPQRMYRNGREPDQVFEPAERLFHRLRQEMMLGAIINPLKIGYANLSVNREKYSVSEDVIFGMPSWGILYWLVADVPSNVKPSNEGLGEPFDFRPSHAPEWNNYAHSEIWAYKGNVRVQDPNPSKVVKKMYRQLMSERAKIIKLPEI